ncbi:hypothetical protein VRK_19030 [Vibrio sp. MEBiC08052]|nr:hypothetical protein VRK_19030 [Vibrio sp. MEBiC08052]
MNFYSIMFLLLNFYSKMMRKNDFVAHFLSFMLSCILLCK